MLSYFYIYMICGLSACKLVINEATLALSLTKLILSFFPYILIISVILLGILLLLLLLYIHILVDHRKVAILFFDRFRNAIYSLKRLVLLTYESNQLRSKPLYEQSWVSKLIEKSVAIFLWSTIHIYYVASNIIIMLLLLLQLQ